jgi:thymidylate kinase
MKNIKMITITGGTCAGKTTAFERIKEELKIFENLYVIHIPESATEMMSLGISPLPNVLGDKFQEINLTNQLTKETLAKCAAREMVAENVLIICDRSTYEQQVFVDEKLWNQILVKLSLSNEKLMNSYDAVFHLISTAIGAEYAYGMISNKHRIHNLEEARNQELRAQKLWTEHKNFKIFDNSKGFKEKMDEVAKAVIDFVLENYDL